MLIHDILKSLSEADQKSRIVTQYVEVIINDELLINRFSNILTIQLPTNQQIEQCLFSTSGVSEIDELLNVVKMLVLKEFNYFLGLINKSKSQVKFFQTRFYSFIQDNCINGVLNSVFVFCKSDMINIETALKVRFSFYSN